MPLFNQSFDSLYINTLLSLQLELFSKKIPKINEMRSEKGNVHSQICVPFYMTLKGSYPVSNISKKMKGRLEFDVQAWSHAISKFEEYIQLRIIMKYAVIFVIDTI